MSSTIFLSTFIVTRPVLLAPYDSAARMLVAASNNYSACAPLATQ
jgi:hypothetical protein